jgi:tetratricopeptide (TPR) repeat protein
MFEFGRELRRVFSGGVPGAFKDGLTGGDSALLELLDLRLLMAEARAADVAAGRVSARDPAARQLEASIVWREIARRSGDPVALRKAASHAEAAGKAFAAQHRDAAQARARVEQAQCAMLGAELFGDDGLNAAAETVLRETTPAPGFASSLARCLLAGLAGRRALADGGLEAALDAAQAYETPFVRLAGPARNAALARLALADQRGARADILAGCGSRLKDLQLVGAALREIEMALASLDAAYEPLIVARLNVLKGSTLTLQGELTGDVGLLADGVDTLTAALSELSRDHSPLDWAKAQASLGLALQALGEATDAGRAFENAVSCFDRALLVLADQPELVLRATVVNNRAACLGLQAELTGDLAVLDAAEAAFKTELAGLSPGRDAVPWAIAQVNLARLYETRVEITGRDDGALDRAATALSVALDVFGEQGLRSLADLAARGLERLRERVAQD